MHDNSKSDGEVFMKTPTPVVHWNYSVDEDEGSRTEISKLGYHLQCIFSAHESPQVASFACSGD